MAKKPKPKPPELPPGYRALSPEEGLTYPEVQAACAMNDWASHLPVNDLSRLVNEIRGTVEKVADGNLKPVEAMLVSQAVALQNLFTSLTRRAAHQQYLKQQTAYLTLGLKAQAQCRATLEALAEVKNPRTVAFVKQANVAHGPQQVNNGPQPSRVENSPTAQNELLEAPDESRMVPGTTGAASGCDQAVEAVGAVNRTPDP